MHALKTPFVREHGGLRKPGGARGEDIEAGIFLEHGGLCLGDAVGQGIIPVVKRPGPGGQGCIAAVRDHQAGAGIHGEFTFNLHDGREALLPYEECFSVDGGEAVEEHGAPLICI